MYLYMGHMTFDHLKPYEDWFWEKNRIYRLRDYVEGIDTDAGTVACASGKRFSYDRLIIATGSKTRYRGWPGQNLLGVQGMYNVQDIQCMEQFTRGIDRGVIVGDGLIGVEMVEMLRSRNIGVTLLGRHRWYWGSVLPPEEGALIGRELEEHGVDFRPETELREIRANEAGRVGNIVTSRGEIIDCGFVGIATGVAPNIDVVFNTGIEHDRGVLVDEYFRTSVPNVYAAGDCAQFREPLPGRKPVEQVWYSARAHGETLSSTVCGDPQPYRPGLWFNSAKFFDIEYQTYGTVPVRPSRDEETFYWEHPDGKKCIRINYEKESGAVIGFNAFGVRLRQKMCEEWINKKTGISTVATSMHKAVFDPEFFPGYARLIAAEWNNCEHKREAG